MAGSSRFSYPMRCLITAGPTREYLDPVRYLSNGSSGKMGYALAAAARERGWDVQLVSGPVSLPPPEGVTLTRVTSAADMFSACETRFAACDVFIAVAAVADYRPARRAKEKTKKQGGPVALELIPTVDILRTLATRKQPHQIVVGFAAETSEVERYACRKLEEKNCDWIIANDVSTPNSGMESDFNRIIVLGRAGQRVELGPARKIELAPAILRLVVP